tara:strand:+ start:450 stop:998 length:549 start_codon:yes stop_codon:yes gene_type:complete
MKGVVFTEFFELVEEKFGVITLNEIIENSDLPVSGGSYTSVGTYPHSEMVNLVVELSKVSKIPVGDLLKVYGEYFFNMATVSYPHFFEKMTNSLDFLETVENHIHVEVLKLYSDAELPAFKTERVTENTLIMDYLSERKLSDFAEGLILGCSNFFKDKLNITKTLLGAKDGSEVRFLIELEQ